MSQTPAREIHTHWIRASGASGGAGDPQARFPYWSFTKTVIALCALKLADAGAVDLDAPLPGARWSLRQLLGHRAGLADYGQIPAYHAAVAAGEEPWPRDEILARVLALGPLFAPGEGWAYSNAGTMLAREHLEAAAGLDFGRLVADLFCRPLRLASLRYARTRADFTALHWLAAASYHPGWVYHGCLTGTAHDAAHLLDAIATGRLLAPARLAELRDAHLLGGPLPGRPWTATGYGLGLMSGRMGAAGRAFGHSGAGPFCVNAVYHFPDRPDPITVACFTDGTDEGVPETEAARIAAAPEGAVP